MDNTFRCYFQEGGILNSMGHDYGAPLKILAAMNPYYLIRISGHLAWSGNYQPREYVSSRYMLLRLTPDGDKYFQAEILDDQDTSKTNYRQIMETMRKKLEELAAGYQGKAVDEWVIYEDAKLEFFLVHVSFIDNLDRLCLDKFKDIDGKETETKKVISPKRVLVHRADFATYEDLYHQAYLIRAEWLNTATAITAHRKELDRQWEAGRDVERTRSLDLYKKFKNTP